MRVRGGAGKKFYNAKKKFLSASTGGAGKKFYTAKIFYTSTKYF